MQEKEEATAWRKSTFFNHILKALGFTVYMIGVRIRPRVGGVVTIPDGESCLFLKLPSRVK